MVWPDVESDHGLAAVRPETESDRIGASLNFHSPASLTVELSSENLIDSDQNPVDFGQNPATSDQNLANYDWNSIDFDRNLVNSG